MSEFVLRMQFVAGMIRLGKTTMVREPKLYLGRRKRAQLLSGRTRV